MMRPEEISDKYATEKGRELFMKTKEMSNSVTQKILNKKLRNSTAPRIIKEELDNEDLSDEVGDHEIDDQKSQEKGDKTIEEGLENNYISKWYIL